MVLGSGAIALNAGGSEAGLIEGDRVEGRANAIPPRMGVSMGEDVPKDWLWLLIGKEAVRKKKFKMPLFDGVRAVCDEEVSEPPVCDVHMSSICAGSLTEIGFLISLACSIAARAAPALQKSGWLVLM